jgi:hypothetical protein
MRNKVGAAATLVIALGNCACTVPPLWSVINNAPNGPPISVDEIVQRVKCELADALRQKMEEKNLKWLKSWTAKADLTLQVNESGGITPNVTFTQPLHNAYNLRSGPASVAFPSLTESESRGDCNWEWVIEGDSHFSI